MDFILEKLWKTYNPQNPVTPTDIDIYIRIIIATSIRWDENPKNLQIL